MKQLFALLAMLLFFICGQGVALAQHTVISSSDSTSMSAWKKHQDSLRTAILNTKDNTVLKESFLQELYIRNTVQVENDNVFITIPFNLHSADCGAPDCYSTDVSFGFKLGDTVVFPEKLQFHEQEHGCTNNEYTLSGTFQLAEQNGNYVIYHSSRQKRTLVLFSSDKRTVTNAYYFTDVKKNSINGENVVKILRNFSEEDKHAIYPYRSWLLSTNEYEHFLHE